MSKLHPVPGLLKGKRIVLVDDSIVRGTTFREIVPDGPGRRRDSTIDVPDRVPADPRPVLLRRRHEGPATASSPTGRDEAEIARAIGADSVHYLSMAGLVESITLPAESLCLGCLTGKYPVNVPEEHHRFQKSLEEF